MSVANATRGVATEGFALAVGAGLAGFLVSEILTAAIRQHVFDIPFKGGDAVYAVVIAIALQYAPVIPNEYARPMALGCVMSGGLTTLEDFGVVGRLKAVTN